MTRTLENFNTYISSESHLVEFRETHLNKLFKQECEHSRILQMFFAKAPVSNSWHNTIECFFFKFQMIKWLKILLFAAIVGFAKGHHFIRLVILAGLGLAGLWMVHTLAQDFNTIQTNTLNNINNNNNDDQNNNNNGGGYQTSLFKRSIPEATNHHSQINWEVVLSRDPASCARSFLCQLAASEEKTLSKEEKIILNLVR